MTTHTGLPGALSATSSTLIDRSVRLTRRNVDTLVRVRSLLPLLMMSLFVYVFGGAIDTGTRTSTTWCPGDPAVTTGYGASNTAMAVADDMTTGMIDRFRSLPIRGVAVLTGHVTASVARNAVSTAIVVARRARDRLPPDRDRRRMARRDRSAAALRDRAVVARRGARRDREDGRVGERAELLHAVPALPEQRVRAAETMPSFLRRDQRAPADHAGDRDRARLPDRYADRQQRLDRARLVRRAARLLDDSRECALPSSYGSLSTPRTAPPECLPMDRWAR